MQQFHGKTANPVTPIWAAAALGVMLVLAAIIAPSMGIGLYMTSGVWAALAMDLADGTFYRPIVSDMGYGGTRYFPLHFVLHAGLIRLLGNPVAGAYIISYSAGLALLAGLYRCLRTFDVPARFAAACTILTFSALSVQACLYQIRPDILAAAFNVWGLSYCIRPKPERKRWIVVASVFFALAFMTKFTTVFGVTAAVMYWMLMGRRRDAAMLAGLTAGISVVALLGVHVASEGRALESFLACAAGNTSLRTLLMGPVQFFRKSIIDIPFLLIFAAALMALLVRLRSGIRDLPILLFGLTLGATVIIASESGAGINHFIDMQIASGLLCTVHLASAPANRFVRYALPVGGFLGAATIVIAVVYMNTYETESRYVHQEHIIGLAGDSAQPLLSDDPWIPILAGERPYMLDNFSLRTMSENDPAIANDLFEKLDDRFFRAAILFYGRRAPRGRDRNLNIETDARRLYYRWMLYPEGLYDRLTQNYAPIEFVGDYLVLLPR